MIDKTHMNWTATIPCYCKEVYDSGEFEAGHAILVDERAIEEHEWAVGEVFKDAKAVIAIIPSAPYELGVYWDTANSNKRLYIVRMPGGEIPDDWSLVKTIPAQIAN